MAQIALHDIPGGHRVYFRLPSAGAADATSNHPVATYPFKAVIGAVKVAFAAAVTGHANHFNLNLIEKTADAELAAIDFALLTDAVAWTETALTLATAAVTARVAGTVLNLQREKVNTGVDMPELVGYVEFKGA